jgi:hypothetical protein
MHAFAFVGAVVRGLFASLLVMSVWSSAPEPAAAQGWTHFVSEEHGEGNPAQCHGSLVSGLGCSGRYCDNVGLECSAPVGTGDSFWSSYFSEEGSAEFVCPEGHYVTGARCSGRYCDNVSLRCTRAPDLRPSRCYWTPDISEENGGRISFGAGTYLRGVHCSGRYCDNLRSYVCQTEASCQTQECVNERARRFAPVLRFDQVQGADEKCFPGDAASYYQARKSGSRARICNTDVSSIEQNRVPIYFDYQDCSGDTTIIMYWFFYGYQDTCTGNAGSHDADWERIAVKVKNGRLERVLYYQHAGSYTRNEGEYGTYDGTHPVVYVGKNSHGSYHDDGGSGSCLYFEDYRNPGSRNLSMYTWTNLVELDNGWNAPEWMRDTSSAFFDGIPGPLARGVDVCSLRGCAGNDTRIGALCFGQCGCAKSSIGSSPF